MTQPNVLELAKQGDPQAIASLMNHHLQSKGIAATATLKDCCLSLMLEGSSVPEQQAMILFVRGGITSLGAKSIKRVKVYGRQTGDEFPVWNHEIELGVHDNSALCSNTSFLSSSCTVVNILEEGRDQETNQNSIKEEDPFDIKKEVSEIVSQVESKKIFSITCLQLFMSYQ